jgi:uncharacterized protein (TIGR03437 family)
MGRIGSRILEDLMKLIKRRRLTTRETAILLFIFAAAILILSSVSRPVDGQGAGQVTTVSAANYTGVLAPEAIAAGFGANLATQTVIASSVPLPTNLAGTTVRVNNQLAPLFFVSFNQVNFLIPAGTTAGTATVTVTSGNGAVSNGTVQISASAPAVFSLDSTGTGLPAAYYLRSKPNGQQIQEPINQPLNFGPAEDRVFLILFLSGLRAGGVVRVHVGGVELTPDFVGIAPGFTGLDQINVELNRSLAGRGRVPAFVTVNNSLFSNVVDIDIASATGAPQIISFAPGQTLAGDELMINGNGFAGDAGNNKVAILDPQGNPVYAQVVSANATQIRVRVPYGAISGAVRVETPQGQIQSATPLQMRTSASGFLEESFVQNGQILRRPLQNVTVRLRPPAGQLVTRQTNVDGSFIFPDVVTGLSLIDVNPLDTGTVNLQLPNVRIKMQVLANRDNQYPNSVELTQIQGNSLSVNAGQQGGAMTTINPGGNLPTNFGLPSGCQVFQPPNGLTNTLTISLFQTTRTPLNLPVGYFSSAIAQVTPFGARMSPGGTLSLPNPDGLTGGNIRCFRLDEPTQSSSESPTTGEFIDVGVGSIVNDSRINVIENGQQVGNGITQTSFYFLSPLYPTARISGRVLASDGTPVSRAIIRSRGQSTFTASDGRFTLLNVPVIKTSNDAVSLDVNFARADGAVDRTVFGPIGVTANGQINLGADITLPGRTSPDQPLVLAPAQVTVNEGQTLDFSFVALSQPQAGQVVAVATSGVPFASVIGQGNGVFTLRLAPGTGTASTYLMRLTATGGGGSKYTLTIPVRVRAPGNQPTADDQSVATTAGTPRNITLTGRDPQNRPLNLVLFSSPSRGTLSGVNPNIIYTPQPGFTGIDSFTYRAVPQTGTASELSTIYVIVR